MLASKRKGLTPTEWSGMVEQVRQSVERNSSEFLGHDLPDRKLLSDILEEIFHDFMRECAYHDAISTHRSKRH